MDNKPNHLAQPPKSGRQPSDDSEDLNMRRKRAVQLRLEGAKLDEISQQVGLSNPTIISAHKAFIAGGWEAVKTRPRGRALGARHLPLEEQHEIKQLLLNSKPEKTNAASPLWNYALAGDWLTSAWPKKTWPKKLNLRTATSYFRDWGIDAPFPLTAIRKSVSPSDQAWLKQHYPELTKITRTREQELFFVGAKKIGDHTLIHAHSLRGSFSWLTTRGNAAITDYLDFFNRLKKLAGKPIQIVVNGIDIASHDQLKRWFESNNSEFSRITDAPRPVAKPETKPLLDTDIPASKTEQLNRESKMSKPGTSAEHSAKPDTTTSDADRPNSTQRQPEDGVTMGVAGRRSQDASSESKALTHLQRLEAESIHILREVIAEADNPVMLYSTGKDSAVMLHLARKAFFPAPLPFQLLHVDTTWKFKSMYEYREQQVEKLDLDLIRFINAEGIEKGVNPISHGSALHTDIMKTEALIQAIEKHRFDVAIGGARRDEEKSRAKERIFSFRSEQHRWDPKKQRPELWNLYNTRKQAGESIRVFPLSNWTELDIWQYIYLEQIAVVPLYFASERPMVERDGNLIMVDDERLPLQSGEVPMMRQVRFRSLGCYPLTGAIESKATTVPEIIAEMLLARTSERVGRMIDHDASNSMEKKKQEGYF